MKAVVFDTETTGLTRLSFANRANYRQWPRLIQLAWAEIDEDRITSRHATLIRPDNFPIPPEAVRVHGITETEAQRCGICPAAALDDFEASCDGAETIIAHNLNFDLGVLQSEALRLERKIDFPPRRICTVHLGRQFLVRKKGIKRGGYPSLSRLYEILFGFGFSGSHDTANDVTACFHIYKKLAQLGYR